MVRSIQPRVEVLRGEGRDHIGPELFVEGPPIRPQDRDGADNRFEWDWSSKKPAFGSGGVFVDARGRIWVPGEKDAADPNRIYWLFDVEGRPSKHVVIPSDKRVLALGSDWGYASHPDEVGLTWISRFPLPQ